MKLNFLDTLLKRILFSLGLSVLYIIISGLIKGNFQIDLYSVLLVMVVIYIPVTLFYAIVSTFFTNDDGSTEDGIIDN